MTYTMSYIVSTFLLFMSLVHATSNRELFEFIDEKEEVIRIRRYNLTGSSTYDTKSIEKLRPEKLDTNPKCDGVFEKTEPGVYVGTFGDCRLNLEGQSYPLYFEISTCSSLFVYTPTHAVETSNVLPYHLRKNESFPLPEYLFGPGDYSYAFVNPC